jgi:hypothetical protein
MHNYTDVGSRFRYFGLHKTAGAMVLCSQERLVSATFRVPFGTEGICEGSLNSLTYQLGSRAHHRILPSSLIKKL